MTASEIWADTATTQSEGCHREEYRESPVQTASKGHSIHHAFEIPIHVCRGRRGSDHQPPVELPPPDSHSAPPVVAAGAESSAQPAAFLVDAAVSSPAPHPPPPTAPLSPAALPSSLTGCLQRLIVCPISPQLEHFTLLQSFGSGQSREKCPTFSQLRQVTVSGLRGWSHSLAIWSSDPQLRQVRFSTFGQSFEKWPISLQLRHSTPSAERGSGHSLAV